VINRAKAKVRETPRNRPKQILVPVDFSRASTKALDHAMGLAGDASRIILLHVVEPAAKENRDVARAIDAAKQTLASFWRADSITAPELIKLDVRSGMAFSEILDCAGENDVAMIVLGVHDCGPLGAIALGHTVDRVSRYASCPVLLVPEEGAHLRAARARD
jgi:nucleotide-binding universal stress UspA family protein